MGGENASGRQRLPLSSLLKIKESLLEKTQLSRTETWRRQVPKSWKIFLGITLILGVLLRTIWGSDIEYKSDEHFMFERTQKVGVSEELPLLGMPSGVGTRNPAMSIWVFLGLKHLFFAENPPELARSVEILNILALIGLLLFSLKCVEQKERTAWFWTIALASVNPLAVLLQRKIWAQSTLPFFCVLLLIGWWKRNKKWGAFLFGLIGILIGQIHMSGFFFSAALFSWTFFFSHYLTERKNIGWTPFCIGLILGFFPLIPWIQYFFENQESSTSLVTFFAQSDRKVLLTSLFWQHWVTDPSGLGIWYSLGVQHFTEFLKYPQILDTPTYLVAFAHIGIGVILVSVLIQTLLKIWNSPQIWKSAWIGADSDSSFLRNSALCGYGILLSIAGIFIYRHYLIITFPFESLWLAQITLRNSKKPKVILSLLWIFQLLITSSFLVYIHENGGAPGGDYGVGYQFQKTN